MSIALCKSCGPIDEPYSDHLLRGKGCAREYFPVLYSDFLGRKAQSGGDHGFRPLWIPEFLYDFQKSLLEWALVKGRALLSADCGLGKGPMALVWAENVVRKTNKPVLIPCPLAVSYQFLREAEKFGVQCSRVVDGRVSAAGVFVTNYERLERFNPHDFAGVVCDESSILKNFDGVRRAAITEFLRIVPYRLLSTATAAPNDYIELGTHSEALGVMGYVDMLGRFFKNDQGSIDGRRQWGSAQKWRFKRHAEVPFWRWVCSWARAVRKPSDLGFDDGPFVLPPLKERTHIVKAARRRDGMLFDLPATDMREEREESRRTVAERCEKVAALVDHKEQALVWCNLNEEADRLESLIPGAVQVAGSESDESKEEKLLEFADGRLRVLVTKTKIAAWGLNFQKCAHVTFFPSYSYEQFYQGVRRCWRFGQKRPVTVDLVASEGLARIIPALQRKALEADRMFEALVRHMNEGRIAETFHGSQPMEVPTWL